MRATAIENLLKLMVNASETGDTLALQQYAAKAHILLNRENMSDASVIRELVNQSVELRKGT